MKRLLSGVFGGLIAASLFVVPAFASTQDFHFLNFAADYYLSVDKDKRSVLKTVETLTAQFPTFDQNHGIERAIPKIYDGHPTHLTINSVTDTSGTPLHYSTYDSNGNLVLRIGDADRYVHGPQTYVLTYTQHDVTNYFKDTNDDEFYWDTNGLSWPQSFYKVSARVHVADALKQYITTNRSCAYGPQGATTSCVISEPAAGEFVASTPGPLGSYQNMTIAVGFQPHTFAAYQQTIWERAVDIWGKVQLVAIAISIVLAIWLITRFNLVNERGGKLGPIPPEYIPPKDMSVTTACQFVTAPRSVMAAQLIDLAVRHYVRIYEVKEKSLFRPAEYEIEIIKDTGGLMWEEKELLRDTFGKTPAIGERLNLKTLKNNTAFYTRTMNNDKDLKKLVRGEYGLREKDEQARASFKKIAKILVIVTVLSLSPVFILVSALAFGLSFAVWPLTEKGLELKRYLLGFKEYIKLAEKDRLEVLQSPEGVEKVGADIGTDTKKRLELYERTLPYAILFSKEKQWNKQLGSYYEQANAQPDWYSGHSGVFQAAAFSSAMSSFSSATNYASSSSSGSGGGSSGGGGGGGGGGGW